MSKLAILSAFALLLACNTQAQGPCPSCITKAKVRAAVLSIEQNPRGIYNNALAICGADVAKLLLVFENCVNDYNVLNTCSCISGSKCTSAVAGFPPACARAMNDALCRDKPQFRLLGLFQHLMNDCGSNGFTCPGGPRDPNRYCKRCQVGQNQCDDGNTCTIDVCRQGFCVHQRVNCGLIPN